MSQRDRRLRISGWYGWSAVGALVLLLAAQAASAAPCAGPSYKCHCHDGNQIRFKCVATPPASGMGVMTWPTPRGNGRSGVSGTGTAAYVFTSGWQTDDGNASATYTASGPNCDTKPYTWSATGTPHCDAQAYGCP